ncbi:hypothetical protein GH714_040278 [Hevea brasiliensis]|uniref:Uncharacterized protein n=1 Tax=Hevea brasiliensis TaxID=3981 RepID=A0A6A6MU76_HEVBR|nr:hypothetical protein GH714_040278 [Hevea brasiliensis]
MLICSSSRYILEHVAKSTCRALDHAASVPGENTSDKKKKNKNKNQAVSAAGEEAKSSLESQDTQYPTKSSQVRTFANGLVIEESEQCANQMVKDLILESAETNEINYEIEPVLCTHGISCYGWIQSLIVIGFHRDQLVFDQKDARMDA